MANEQNLKPCKPGETHNPNGRPKGAVSFKTILKKIAEQKEDFVNPITNEKGKSELIMILGWKLFEKARRGDLKAIEMVRDSLDGKPNQALEHSGPDGNPIEISLQRKKIIEEVAKDMGIK